LAIGTAIALPIISSIIAPVAAQAASTSISGACMATCLAGTICACGTSHSPCPPGFVFNIGVNVTLGLCVTAVAEATINFNPVAAGANANICLIADACLVV
jgi:hypothetical protein